MKYIPSIGIECHVQLSTATKLFAAVANDAREAAPNTLVSHICLALPGTLPVLNERAVEYAVKVAFALHTKPQKISYFERKHYFYPDLPKGYQLTQLHEPIIKGGYVEIETGSGLKKIRINRVQLEEDAGKNLHPAGRDYTLVDLNRAGTPLLEIVSEPDMSSPAEAKAYARELYLLARYLGVSDADMFHGNLRFDVNVSLSPKKGELGVRTETKNLNSFRHVEKAVEYEIKRQSATLAGGGAVVQETRGWDEAKQKTFPQRGKEEAHDYRYMPDPDLPPLEISPAYAAAVAETLPVLPSEWRKRLRRTGLDSGQIEILLEAEIDNQSTSYLKLCEEAGANLDFVKKMADWLVNVEIPLRRAGEARLVADDAYRLGLYEATYQLTRGNKLSSTNAKALVATVLRSGARPRDIGKYAKEQGLLQVSDEHMLAAVIKQVIKDNPQAVADVRRGERKALDFLVGQVMKVTAGRADPNLARKLIQDILA